MKLYGVAYLNDKKVTVVEIRGQLVRVQILDLRRKTTWVTMDKLTFGSKDATVRQQ